MTEEQRIRTLVERGTLDATQADRLLAALAALDEDTSVTTTGTAAPDPSARAPASDAPHEGEATSNTVKVRRWLHVRRRTVHLEVRAEDGLTTPTIDDAPDGSQLVAEGDVWRLDAGDDADGWATRLLRNVRLPATRVRVPRDIGVDLDVFAGSVDVDGVVALRGRVQTGEIEAENVRHVDVHVSAGEIDVEIDPIEGVHAIRIDAGTATLTLPHHAHATVEGSVRVGDAKVDPPFREHHTGVVGRTVDGSLGDGSAAMRLAVGTGTLTVEVR